MGLDAVELVMDIEEAFDIQIPDERAAEVATVGQLYDSILEACPTRRSDDLCMSAATFRLIRRAMQSDLGLDVRRLRPRDSVDSVFPRDRRRQTWSRLADTLDLRFPKLVRPTWITALATIITVATGVGCGYLSHLFLGSHVVLIIGAAAAVASGLILKGATTVFAVNPCESFTTFRGLTGVVLAHNYATLSRRFNTWAPSDIWEALRVIIVEQLGVKPELVTPQASLVHDLGMG
jgi:acyl carrier protein